MSFLSLELVWPMLGAAAAGAIIGAEREYRASPAGFRTHILVSLSSGLLMLAAVHQIHWLSDTPQSLLRIDPVRMAHGILTGIGFLCGGVIFREGFTVRGLTTAASLWTTSALGVLFGIGFYSLAVAGTIATLIVLAAASVTEALLPQSRFALIKVRYRRDTAMSHAAFAKLLSAQGLKAMSISQSADEHALEFSATIAGSDHAKAEALASGLLQDENVLGFDLVPHDS